MPVIKIEVPFVGESLSQAVLLRWAKLNGDVVERDEELVEFESDKTNFTISAPEKGTLTILINEGEVVNIGETVGEINTYPWSL